MPNQQPLITAIVSTYNAERFMHGCMEDLIAQTIFEKLEILVIDSGSQQGESAICAEYASKFPQIKLLRTEREPLYAAWNRVLPLARGRYLTNCNTDDRHRHDFFEIMSNALTTMPDVALAYSEQYSSEIENETFEQCASRNARIQKVPEYAPAELMLRCITGSQPMWRRELHDQLGSFDTRYQIAADHDMWLRIASRYPLYRVPGPLGVFFSSPQTISGSNNRAKMNRETLAIQQHFMAQAQWRTIPGIHKALSRELFCRGYQRIENERDGRAAEPFIREAIRLDPSNFKYLKTYLLRCVISTHPKPSSDLPSS